MSAGPELGDLLLTTIGFGERLVKTAP
jgi:hypothetical protein